MITADSLLTIALERGLCTGEDPLAGDALARAVAAEFGLPFVTLAGRDIPAEVLAPLPRAFAQAHAVMPYARADGVLQVAVADPLAVDVIDTLVHLAGAGSSRPSRRPMTSPAPSPAAMAAGRGRWTPGDRTLRPRRPPAGRRKGRRTHGTAPSSGSCSPSSPRPSAAGRRTSIWTRSSAASASASASTACCSRGMSRRSACSSPSSRA